MQTQQPEPAQESPEALPPRKDDEASRSLARYKALFDSLDEGFCIIEFVDGPDGPLSDYVHIEANAGYARHTGIPDIVGKTVYDIAPIDARSWVDLYGQVLATGEPLRFEREFREVGRHIEVSATRLEPAHLNQVSVLFRDITARKVAEAALRGSEAVARENAQRVQLALAAGAIIGTWIWDLPNDRFTVDEPFALAFGLDPKRGRTGLSLDQVIETVHPEDRDGLMAAIEEAVELGIPLDRLVGMDAFLGDVIADNADILYLAVLDPQGRVQHARGLPEGVADRLRARFRFYDWDAARREVRWVCGFDTTEEDVDAFTAALRAELVPAV